MDLLLLYLNRYNKKTAEDTNPRAGATPPAGASAPAAPAGPPTVVNVTTINPSNIPQISGLFNIGNAANNNQINLGDIHNKLIESANTALDELFNPKSVGPDDPILKEMVSQMRANTESRMRRGISSIVDPKVKAYLLSMAQGRVPTNPGAAYALQLYKIRERAGRIASNHLTNAAADLAHLRAVADTVKEYEGSIDSDAARGKTAVPSFDRVLSRAQAIVPTTVGITGSPNKANPIKLLRYLANYAAKKEDPSSIGIVNNLISALDRLKNEQLPDGVKSRDKKIVNDSIEYLVRNSKLGEKTLANLFGSGNSEFKPMLESLIYNDDIRAKLGLSYAPVSD
jgi:hypothetical protein